jgi:hypothetical protein
VIHLVGASPILDALGQTADTPIVAAGLRRSDKWPALERKMLEQQPFCSRCGGRTELCVHHCAPFHIEPSEELDVRNLLVVCIGPLHCHLQCHCGDWSAFDVNCREHSAEYLKVLRTARKFPKDWPQVAVKEESMSQGA